MSMYIYSVATWTPVHTPCCNGFNSRYSKIRTYVEGVYFSRDLAKAEADRLSNARKPEKYWVMKHKIKDGDNYQLEGAGI